MLNPAGRTAFGRVGWACKPRPGTVTPTVQ